MTKKQHQKLICIVLFVAGIACCVAGFFLSPFLVLGAAFLAGSLGVAANILDDKDRITVNNNYSNYTIPESPDTPAVTEPLLKSTPSQKLKSFFGFKNKKFMDHHDELERVKNTPIEEHESNSMQLPAEMLAEIKRLNDAISKLDINAIDKGARAFQEKSHSHEHDNKID